jgi:hypothetical protein
VRYNPYAPRYVWLYDHRKAKDGEDPWVEAEFVHQRLIADTWTQYIWEQATAAHVEASGRRDQERAIAQAVAEMRERARGGPEPEAGGGAARRPRRRKPVALFTGPKLATRSPEPDPYAGIPSLNPATVVRAPSLNIDAQGLFPGPRPEQAAQPLPPHSDVPRHGTGTPPADTAGTTRQASPIPPVGSLPARVGEGGGDPLRLDGTAAELFQRVAAPPRHAPPHEDESSGPGVPHPRRKP